MNEDAFARICDGLASGESVSTMLKREGSNWGAFHNFVSMTEDRRKIYARAREVCIESHVAGLVALSDEAIPTDEDGRLDSAAVNHLRLRIDTRKWVASKLIPKTYGDRTAHEHSGPDGAPITVITSIPANPALDGEHG